MHRSNFCILGAACVSHQNFSINQKENLSTLTEKSIVCVCAACVLCTVGCLKCKTGILIANYSACFKGLFVLSLKIRTQKDTEQHKWNLI